MATSIAKEVDCKLVTDGDLILENADHDPDYTGLVVSRDMLMVADYNARNVRLHRRYDGKFLAAYKLEDQPCSICLINNNEICAILVNFRIVIMSVQCSGDTGVIRRVRTLHISPPFDSCHGVVKCLDKLIISGRKQDNTICWCIVSFKDGHVHAVHQICKGGRSYICHLTSKDNMIYISCHAGRDSLETGVYGYDIQNSSKQKCMYTHKDLNNPRGITADAQGFIFVCNWYGNCIHHLTGRCELVTIYREDIQPSTPREIFCHHGHLYVTSLSSNVITRYKPLYSHQVIPREVLKMDTRSIHMYKEALKAGKEKVHNIRVMVVGQYGVGKTTLTKRLLGEDVKISETNSTEGIDVHIECCKVSLATGVWTTQEKNADKYSRLQRLVRLLNVRGQKHESEGEQEGQNEMEKQTTITEYDNRHPQHDQPVSTEHDISREDRFASQLDVNLDASSEVYSSENEEKKDAVMEILQLVNDNSDKLERSMVEYAALAIWDFAGQYVFYTTHQTFLTRRAIYLLVIDLSQPDTDFIKDDCFLDIVGLQLCKVHDLIEIWLNSIHSCAPSPKSGIPAVILVGTHVDKIPEKSRQKVIDEYFRKIRYMLRKKPTIHHLLDDIAIDNTLCDPNPGLEELKRRIFELAKQQPYWGEEKPARWLPLEQAIMTLKASGVKVAPLILVEEINRSGSVRIDDSKELDLFLRFQHKMGTILYFNVEGLREKIVLDPQWMIDALKSLITAEAFIKRNPAITSKWYTFKEKGKLTHELLDVIWSKEKRPEFHDNKDHILLLMERLNIIARPRLYIQDGKKVKVENYFLAPCMLSEITPVEVISPKQQPEMESSSVLCYVFVENFLPSPVFHRLLAPCVAHWPIAKKNSEYLIFCGCCVFDLDLHHRMTVFFREHVIFVRVARTGTTEKTPSSKLCIKAKEFITMTLRDVIGHLGQSLRFDLFIRCPKSDGYSVNCLIPVADLLRNVDVPCHFHSNSHVIMSHEMLKCWFQEEIASKKQVASTSKKQGIQQSLLIQLSEDIISSSWKFFFRALSVTESEIDEVRTDNPDSVQEQIYQLLHRLNQRGSLNKSNIIQALERIKRNDLVKQYRQIDFSEC